MQKQQISEEVMFMNISSQKFKMTALILLATGYGWAGGHFIPENSNILPYLFQLAVISLVIWLASNVEKYSRGITWFTIITLSINILNIIHGSISKTSHSFGSQNRLSDLVPVLIIMLGSLCWLMSLKGSMIRRSGNI